MLEIDTLLLTGSLCTASHRSSDGCTHETSVVEHTAGSYMAGAFRLSFGTHVSPFLKYNASAETVRTALVAMNSEKFKYVTVERVNIRDTSENQQELRRARDASGRYGSSSNDDHLRYQGGYRWCINFFNVPGDIDAVTIDGSKLEGAGVSVASEEEIAGHERLAGSFVLTFHGQTTSKISYDASSEEVTAALEMLSNVGSVSVTRSNQLYHHSAQSASTALGSRWNITFTSLFAPPNLGPLPLMSINSLLLTGTSLTASVRRLSAGCCTFRLSSNGVDFTPIGLSLPYRFDEVSIVTSVMPITGPARGGTILTVSGVGFWSGGTVSCIFGEIPYHVEVSATRVDATTVLCVTPVQPRGPLVAEHSSGELSPNVFFGRPLERGSVRVRVTMGGVLSVNATSQSQTYFTYNKRSTITALVPKTGPLDGGTHVYIHGSDFPQQQGYAKTDVLCRFGDAPTLVIGVYLSSTELVCVSPSVMSQTPDTTGTPQMVTAAYVTLEVSFNGGVDFTHSGVQFWYRSTPQVFSVVPMRGPARGGTSIVITGIHFERSLHLSCKFGNSLEDISDSDTRSINGLLTGPSIVSAKWISSSSISCSTPPLELKSEVQMITLRSREIVRHVQIIRTLSRGPGSNITGGSFHLLFGDYDFDSGTYPEAERTESLQFDSAAIDIKNSLEALPSIIQVDVTRSGPFTFGSYDWTVTFVSSVFAVPDLAVETNSTNLTDGASVITETVVPGSNYGITLQQESISLYSGRAPQSSIQKVTLEASSGIITYAEQTMTIVDDLNANIISGTFSVKITNVPAPSSKYVLSPTATAMEVQEAIEHAMSTSLFEESIESNIRVTRSHARANRGYEWTITFVGVPMTQNNIPFTFDGIEIDTHTLSNGVVPTLSAITPPAQPLGGKYRLVVINVIGNNEYNFDQEETVELSSHASAASVEQALNNLLPTKEARRILVSENGIEHNLGEKVTFLITFPASFGVVPLVAVNSTILSGTNVVQSVSIIQQGVVQPSSSFTLNVGSNGPTTILSHDASAKQVEHAIEKAAASIQMDVHVTRSYNQKLFGYVWEVTFPEFWQHTTKSLIGTYVPLLGSHGIADELTLTTTLIQAGTYSTLGGQFNLSFPSAANYASPSITPVDTMDNLGNTHLGRIESVASISIPWDASASTVQDELRTLPYVRQVTVTRINANSAAASSYPEDNDNYAGYVWAVTFLSYGSYLHEGFVPLLEAAAESMLTGNDLYLDVEVLQEGNGPSVAVEVTNNGQQYTMSHELFQYHPSIILGTLHPLNGPSIGGTIVIVRLAEHSFLDVNRFQFEDQEADPLEFEGQQLNGLTCKFNDSIVPATVISPDSVSCISPPHVTGNTSVSVSLNGEDFSNSVLTYRYDLSSRAMSVSPLSGPITGGTVISVKGLNFEGTWNMDRVKCSFGGEVVKAFRSTHHTVKCRAPPVPAPRSVSVEISTNEGIDFTNEKVQYYYEEIRHVSSVEPRVGPSTGNTLITVTGGPFPNYTSTLFCRFGNQPVPAQFISESTLQCVSPRLRPVREIQSITYGPVSDNSGTTSTPSGTFALVVGETCKLIASGSICLPQLTGHMNWNASALTMKRVLETLPEIGTVRVTRIPHTNNSISWHVTFMSDLQRGNMEEMEIADSSVYPTSSYAMAVSTLLNGSDSATGRVAVEVTSNAVDYTQDGVVFEYQPIVHVTRIYPTHGPLYGRTEVYVYGRNFRNTSGLYCHFGLNNRGSAVPATAYINSSCIKCVTPPVLYVRSVRVEVSNNGANPLQSNRSTIGQWYTFDRPLKILNIYPKTGPNTGNTSVRIVGENFLPTDEMKCKFGSYIVRAVWLNGHELVCRSPAHTPGSFPLEITANNQDYTSQNLPYLFYAPVFMVNIAPVSGPAWAAGTPLHIYGGNFFNTSTLSCRVADVSVPAEYLSDTEMVCYTPPCLNSYTGGACKMVYQPLSAHMNLVKDPRTGSLKLFPTAHYYPLYYSKLVPVEISNNGQDFTNSGIRYLYQQDAVITAIAPDPARGWDTGYTSLYITGQYFVNSTALRCRIGDRTTRATFVTSRLIFCSTPTHPTSEMDHGQHRHSTISQPNFDHADKGRTRGPASARNAGNVFVEITNNGEDFTSSYTFFNYTGPCPNGYYCPIHDLTSKQQCPRGTYCRGEGNRNFTMCPLGTYQPMLGQSDCRRCPVGYICPDEGMIVPRLCPPGFVCDVTGLSMADQPCPQGHFCLEGTATSATTCGRPKPSSSLYPTLSHAERSSTIRSSRKSRGHQLILGARNTACWQNKTTDFALQVNPYPARFWMERHALPLSSTATFKPIRGRYCLDDSCLRLEDAENMTVSDYMFDYSTSAYALRRPVPCPAGTYCHPGTAVASGNMKNFSTPQPCFESMYCPEGSLEPKGVGQCPKGYYSPFGARIACPAGSYCPMEGHWDPLPCPPGTFNSMIAQLECSKCPEGKYLFLLIF